MGQMAELNLAACRDENVRLRAAVGKLQGMVNGLLGQDRRGAVEVAMVSACLGAGQIAADAVRNGRTAARLYIEALTAEAEEAPAAEAEKGASDVAGE
jgi:predicted RNase H-like HicB family nuclease